MSPTKLNGPVPTGALLNGMERSEAVRWLIQTVCDHHLAFGHGAIYVQKAFEMLNAVGETVKVIAR